MNGSKYDTYPVKANLALQISSSLRLKTDVGQCCMDECVFVVGTCD